MRSRRPADTTPPAAIRDGWCESAYRAERVDHALLVAVCGVYDQQIDLVVEDLPYRDIPVDTDRRRNRNRPDPSLFDKESPA
jgi:hypothetical protein